jgi:hypothetical protein
MSKIKSRRKFQKRILSTPPTSPEKKKPKVAEKSSIRAAMEEGKGSLFKFFNKLATEDDKKMTLALWREGRKDTFTQGHGFGKPSDAVNDAKHEHKKELARAQKPRESEENSLQ